MNTDDSISIIMSHNSILVTVTRYQAEEINKIHLLYEYYHLGLSKRSLSLIYRKSIETIEYWISRWEVFKLAVIKKIIATTICDFMSRSMRRIFKKCGYISSGLLDREGGRI